MIGAGVLTLAGYALYKDDPRNYKLDNMLLDNKKDVSLTQDDLEIGLGNLKIGANLGKEAVYEVPVKDLPERLKGKVNRQYPD